MTRTKPIPLLSLIISLALSCFAVPAWGAGQAGTFLSAHQASLTEDYANAAQYFDTVLTAEPDNIFALRDYIQVLVAKGSVGQAVAIAEKLDTLNESDELSRLVLTVHAMKIGDFIAAETHLQNDAVTRKKFQQRLLLSWAKFGQNDLKESHDIIDNAGWSGRGKLFGQYNKALSFAAAGDFESARMILAGEDGGSPIPNRGGNIAYAKILYQLDRADEALALLNGFLGGTVDQELIILRDQIASNQTLIYDFVTNASQGAAEFLLSLAEEDRVFSARNILNYGRLAEYLRPDDTPTTIQIATILRNRDQLKLAVESLAKIPQNHPMFLEGEITRADILREDDKSDAAVEVLQNLTRTHPETPRVYMSLGDVYRLEERYQEAYDAYNEAKAQVLVPQANHWALYFYLGVTAERTDKWQQAEAHLRKALELSPDHPSVLNYLGYSLVERDANLAEAQKMIETASAQRPNDGYITDSLAWVLYRLGKFEAAVKPMEHAATLEPLDPIVNDHLGDVYWKVGRKREAYFQWRRALNFGAEEEDAVRIRQKLDFGLDYVLEQETSLIKSDFPKNGFTITRN